MTSHWLRLNSDFIEELSIKVTDSQQDGEGVQHCDEIFFGWFPFFPKIFRDSRTETDLLRKLICLRLDSLSHCTGDKTLNSRPSHFHNLPPIQPTASHLHSHHAPGLLDITIIHPACKDLLFTVLQNTCGTLRGGTGRDGSNHGNSSQPFICFLPCTCPSAFSILSNIIHHLSYHISFQTYMHHTLTVLSAYNLSSQKRMMNICIP